MFDCSKPDPETLLVTVTYGIGNPDAPYKCWENGKEKCCDPATAH
jgi:hypothetical protein